MMATGQEYDNESIQSCSTDASIIRIRCKKLQATVNSLSDTFSVVQDAYEKLAKDTFKILKATDEMEEVSFDKCHLRGKEARLRNNAVIFTNCLGILSRSLKEHREMIEKMVDEHGKLNENEQQNTSISPTFSAESLNDEVESECELTKTRAKISSSFLRKREDPSAGIDSKDTFRIDSNKGHVYLPARYKTKKRKFRCKGCKRKYIDSVCLDCKDVFCFKCICDHKHHLVESFISLYVGFT